MKSVLVPAHRHHRAARARRARLRQRQHRRARRGTRDAHLCRAGAPQIRFSRRDRLRTRSTTIFTGSARRCSTGSRCRSCRRATGAGRRCICAATSRASCAPPRARNGWRSHGLEHWTEFYTDYGIELAEAIFRPLPQRHRQRLGPPAPVMLQDPAPSTATSSTAPRTNGPSRAPSGPPGTSTRSRALLSADPPAGPTQASLPRSTAPASR